MKSREGESTYLEPFREHEQKITTVSAKYMGKKSEYPLQEKKSYSHEDKNGAILSALHNI